MSHNFLLNCHQNSAVFTKKGRVLVLAGAGSGKTRVIAHRIAHLIQEGISPHAILGLTFTNKAAREMQERISTLVGKEKGKEITLSTFHSFCMKILRMEIHHLGYSSHFSLYDEQDLGRMIRGIAKELSSEADLPLGKISSEIFRAKSKGLSLEELPSIGSKEEDLLLKEIYQRLSQTLRAYNAVDFDHLLLLTLRLFEEHPKILDLYRKRFEHILIDEYQDTNPIQFRLAELLSSYHQHLFVVGDDDQSIYGWRGADVNHILHYKAEEIIKLEQNYRSTPTILQAANSVIAKNQNRHKKNLWSAKSKGEKITLFHAPSDAEEAEGVVQRILSLKENQKLSWREIAILYRSHAQSRHLEIALMQKTWQQEGKTLRGIPYEIWGGVEFTERSEIKDLLAYLRTIVNPLDKEALLRILNIPRRGISDQTLEQLNELSKKEEKPLWPLLQNIAKGSCCIPLQPRTQKGIVSFVETMKEAQERFSKKPLCPSLEWFVEAIQYKKAIEEEVKSEQARLWKWENVQECINALGSFEEEEKGDLQDFIGSLVLNQETHLSKKERKTHEALQLMTFHGAKGLEFRACFLVGLEDHILPHEKSLKEGGEEEERRLFYVALTRACEFLTLSMSRSRRRGEKLIPTHPSRFLLDIPKDLLHIVSWKTL
jgi:DNA helicase II / ATP-dependent DNA helicase PcrA